MSSRSHVPHDRFWSLYRTLLTRRAHFEEFKHLLAMYPPSSPRLGAESADAEFVRSYLNSRIVEWVGEDFRELSIIELLEWRTVVVDEGGYVSPRSRDLHAAL
jgi:hypothetical protein